MALLSYGSPDLIWCKVVRNELSVLLVDLMVRLELLSSVTVCVTWHAIVGLGVLVSVKK